MGGPRVLVACPRRSNPCRRPRDPRARPLTDVQADIPYPLPAPIACLDGSLAGQNGLILQIVLRDGQRLNYLACAFPDELRPCTRMPRADGLGNRHVGGGA
jgi:hypothetical protein